MWKGRPSIYVGDTAPPTFCDTCGKQEVDTLAPNSFNYETGAQEIHRVCPDACKHGDHHHLRYEKPTGLFRVFRMDRAFCVSCGMEINLDCD